VLWRLNDVRARLVSLIGFSIVAMVSVTVDRVIAQETEVNCGPSAIDVQRCDLVKRETIPGTPRRDRSARPWGSSTGERLPYFTADEIGRGADGQPCTRRRTTTFSDPNTPSGLHFPNVLADLIDLSPCPDDSRDATEEVDPHTVAISGWEEVQLRKPQPHIAPGWAITGKTAYLETRGQLSHDFTKDTFLGTLRIRSTGGYFVDWGDGTRTGPHHTEGGPWPDGTITHTYIHVGTYDVVVTEEWSSTWSIGEFGGTLGGLRTEGTIPGFRVEQLQVVVGR
jgi:hypothetical protein